MTRFFRLHLLFKLSLAWIFLATSPTAAVTVTIYSDGDDTCSQDVDPHSHDYTVGVSSWLGSTTCDEATWRFYLNGQLLETYQASDSGEVVSRTWPWPGSARIEVSVRKCGFLTTRKTGSLDFSVGPLPPGWINGPNDLCPNEVAEYSVPSRTDLTSLTWWLEDDLRFSDGRPDLALRTSPPAPISVRAPQTSTVATTQINVLSLTTCGISAAAIKPIKLLRPNVATPRRIEPALSNLCANGQKSFTTDEILGASQYEWQVLGGYPITRTTVIPRLDLTGLSLDGPGSYELRVRAKNRCGAVSDWRSTIIFVLPSTDPDCQAACTSGLACLEPTI